MTQIHTEPKIATTSLVRGGGGGGGGVHQNVVTSVRKLQKPAKAASVKLAIPTVVNSTMMDNFSSSNNAIMTQDMVVANKLNGNTFLSQFLPDKVFDPQKIDFSALIIRKGNTNKSSSTNKKH